VRARVEEQGTVARFGQLPKKLELAKPFSSVLYQLSAGALRSRIRLLLGHVR